MASRYDWVVLDCPPRADGVITSNAMRAATTTLLVVETGAFAMQGALHARNIFETIPREVERASRLRLVATLYDKHEHLASEFLIALQARFGDIMLDTVIRRDEVLREAVAYGVPAACIDAESNAAEDFEALACEMLELVSIPSQTKNCGPADELAVPSLRD